ncbi:hypothetical protein [Formosa algae]|uniref:hypothetical protein n=1 Tax=Formosa algae TaxID=225843 RepID=UPI000CCF0C01|nr:hypothetical protein [Formosa algae]PNW27300.1 hypothetical protein BKP44_13700 [Formosa algae]
MINLLDIKIVKEFLKTKSDGSLYKRESASLEFNEDFNWDVRASRIKYLKSIAALSNRQGCLVLGFTDSYRKLMSLD